MVMETMLHKPSNSYPTTPPELTDHAINYSKTVQLPIDISTIHWTVSRHATKRAACCKFSPGSSDIIISLTWKAFQAYGWEKFKSIIRHELIHVWEYQTHGSTSHGSLFKQKAQQLDAPLRCDAFCPPRFYLICTNKTCQWKTIRHRASKTVTHPFNCYRCRKCGSPYTVEHVGTSIRWNTHSEYMLARQKIGIHW